MAVWKRRERVRAGLRGGGEGAADLAEDLALADDHRFDAGGDAEEMTGGVVAGERGEGHAFDRRLALDFGEQGDDGARVVDVLGIGDVDLGAVAGGEDGGAGVALAEAGKDGAQLVRVQREVLAHGDGRCPVGDADD